MEVMNESKSSPDFSEKTHQLENEKEMFEEKLKNYERDMKEVMDTDAKKFHNAGLETIGKLLQEARVDLETAEKKNKALEVRVRHLQDRLSQHGVSYNLELDEEEVFIPGPSKQIMDKLVRENARLRSQTRTSGDLDEVFHYRQKLQEYENKIEKLTNEKADVKSNFNESGNNPETQKDTVSQTPTFVSNMQTEGSEEIDRLRAANQDLGQKLTELVEMNQRWNHYNTQQDAKIQKLQALLQTSTKTSSTAEGNQKKMQELLEASKEQLISVAREKTELSEQNKHLEESLEKLQEVFLSQGDELRKVKEDLIHIQTNGTPLSNDIEALKAQIQFCTEDFEAEKKDHEKAQSRVGELEKENQNLRREINRQQKHIKQLVSASQGRPQFQSMNIPARSPQQVHPNYPQEGGHRFDPELHLNARGRNRLSPNAGYQVVDSPQMTYLESDMGDNQSKEEFPLQCPKCWKRYRSNQQNELLEHIDICC